MKPTANAADMRAMKVDEAKAIYRAKYWDAMRCDALPAGIDYAVFDFGVNSGITRSGKMLRRCLALSDATGAVDDGVVAASRVVDAVELVVALCAARLQFLQSLRIWGVFGKGWGRRVREVESAALALAAHVQHT